MVETGLRHRHVVDAPAVDLVGQRRRRPVETFEAVDGAGLGIESQTGRDGMLTGLNIDATVRLAQALTIPVIASGGLSNLDDIRNLCAVEG